MALTVNQEKLLIELVNTKMNEGHSSLTEILIQLANASEPQVVNRLKQFAAEREAEITQDIANLDSSVRPNAVLRRDFYAAEAI